LGTFLAHKGLKCSVRHILPPLIHLCCFSIEFRGCNFWSHSRICDRNVKLHVRLIVEEVMDAPAFSKTLSPFLVGLQLESIIVCILVVFHIPDKRLIFLFESCTPTHDLEV